MEIRKDDLRDQKITDFLREHFEEIKEIIPSRIFHDLDYYLEALRSPEITFWSVWEGHELLGCGALKELDSITGEVKSIRTAKAHQRRGVASKILEHIIKEASLRAYHYLNLATGALPEFAPAQALYIKYGFKYRDPFAEYIDDPNLAFMTKKL
ncbi:MAG: GNAT family N-acetyltransferase [Okeania sp. SIO3C4]|nr:GNAT family N-acetyltransferase [Okeania sp. SIO3B3]NER03948.1 GNAT family N-acetyltransferase [Okeania sp. SIO3C4]